MTDQQRFDQTGYASGGHFETPVLDALAAPAAHVRAGALGVDDVRAVPGLAADRCGRPPAAGAGRRVHPPGGLLERGLRAGPGRVRDGAGRQDALQPDERAPRLRDDADVRAPVPGRLHPPADLPRRVRRLPPDAGRARPGRLAGAPRRRAGAGPAAPPVLPLRRARSTRPSGWPTRRSPCSSGGTGLDRCSSSCRSRTRTSRTTRPSATAACSTRPTRSSRRRVRGQRRAPAAFHEALEADGGPWQATRVRLRGAPPRQPRHRPRARPPHRRRHGPGADVGRRRPERGDVHLRPRRLRRPSRTHAARSRGSRSTTWPGCRWWSGRPTWRRASGRPIS